MYKGLIKSKGPKSFLLEEFLIQCAVSGWNATATATHTARENQRKAVKRQTER